MTTSAPEQTVNIPQLLLVLIISGFAIRYFFFSSPASSGTDGTPANNNAGGGNARQRAASHAVRAREADVERIQQMFPQIDRRSIMWNLQRDGGNVGATAERVLSGRGLEVPPISFQPPLPAANSSTNTNTANNSATKSTTAQPDLITRYNLASKIQSSANESESSDTTATADLDSTIANAGARQAWSANKGERQALLQRRREEMILNARRKMEAKVAAERGGKSTTG